MSAQDDLPHRHNDLLFGVRRSVRYHNRRRAFFDSLGKTATIFSAVAGSATVISLLAAALSTKWSIAFAASVAVLSAINLVLNPAQSARVHHDLAKSFLTLEKDILATSPDTVTAEKLYVLTARRLDIEAEEPPPLRVLNCICHNEMVRAMGLDRSEEVKIKWFQRLAAPLFDLCEHQIGPKSS